MSLGSCSAHSPSITLEIVHLKMAIFLYAGLKVPAQRMLVAKLYFLLGGLSEACI